MHVPARERITHLKDASIRTLEASEKAVERQFNAFRLTLSLAAALFLVGFLLVAQWRGVGSQADDLEARPDQDLAIIVHELGAENDALRRETLRLEMRIADVERTDEGQLALLNEAARELQALRVLTGLEPAAGPGVILRVNDPDDVLLTQDFVDVANELRAAGAEAVSIDGIRLGTTTGIKTSPDGMTVGGTPVAGDVVVVRAIGHPATLAQAVGMPGGLAATLGSFPGVTVEFTEEDDLELDAADVAAFRMGVPFEE